MATNANRAATSGRKTPTRPVQDNAGDPADAQAATAGEPQATGTDDTGNDAWPAQAARDHLAWEIASCSAVLRGARALREAQMQAAERAEQAHLQAAERLLTAGGLDEIADIQLQLLRTDAEQALQYWQRLSELATRGALDTLQEAMAGWAQASASAWSGMSQWTRLPGALQATAEKAEAEVEHAANPLAASPLVWPAQEATRQAMDLANATWNDWMSWTGRLADGSARPH
ncbi:phasin family protein [Ideonella sp. BN130291]|uniref:phasin family protein n=1 Tax=Ideonella sp. BN130291 TaxID=3112940 RepID=UPI002E2762E9|nr:phasin family protein [Ideonella sp. BN130291]